MTCGNSLSTTNRGRTFRLCKRGVEDSMAGVESERLVRYGVRITGIEYPVRQVMAQATGTPKIEWTTSNAYRILQNLDFEVLIYP